MKQAIEINQNGRMNQEQLDRIGQRVQHQLSGRLQDFRLKRESTGLILRGRVRTYYAKQLAQHAVMAATDLPIMRNDIEVS
jgi:hypothetical protein